ncbi:hypothetical protein SAMN05880573_101156 [Chryseobacterium sp. RU33C]|nr:hypothetical protein SAMN05880573_101156 [Chryseobacterium sp. RU33C]
MNADVGFGAENLRRICEQKGIIANIAQNKRNSGVDNELYFDEELYKERYSIETTNAWMDSLDLCLIDLTLLYPAGLDSII